MPDKRNWYKLDNVAKIIPSSVEGADTRVFRLVCELKEEVDPGILQTSLERTLPEFPYMSCCLRRGIFWYYLDSCREPAEVMPDNLPALSSLYVPGRRSLLFRITYFDRRINLEMFHVLSDGTGGFVFLVHILTHYISEKYGLDYQLLAKDVSSVEEKEADAFRHFYESRREQKKNNHERVRRNFIREMFWDMAYQLKGEVDEDLQQHLIEGTVSTDKLVETANRFGVTVGILTTSIYVEAILTKMSVHDRRRPIVISVPVNLRQFFPSATTRNFFGAIQIPFFPEKYDGSLESVMCEVKKAFEENLTKEKIFGTMNSYAALEHNYAVKMTPLFLKWPAIHSYNYWMKKGVTTSVSNLGRIELPEEFAQYVDRFASFMSGRTAFLCVTSFRDKTVFGVATCFTRHNIFMHFFRRMVQLGIPVELTTNDFDAEER